MLSIRVMLIAATAATSACSTVQSRLDDPPIFDRRTPTTLQAFQSCFTAATAGENVNYLPRGNGGTYKATAGPQDYVFWIVNIDDLGNERRIAIHAVDSVWGPNKDIIRKVEACIR